jgi:hypothetical protein
MARKREIKKAARRFKSDVDSLLGYTAAVSRGQTAAHKSLIFDGAVIQLYRLFEGLMLAVLVGAINQDTSTLAAKAGIKLPKHLTDDVCQYLVLGNRYFDFKGRDGLRDTIGGYVPTDHYLLAVIKKDTYKLSLNVLSALRNHAAHQSEKSRKAALKATSQTRIGSSGSWLRCPSQGKKNSRFEWLCAKMKAIATDIEAAAPM